MKSIERNLLVPLWCMVMPFTLALFVLFVALTAFDVIYVDMEIDQTCALLNAMSLIAVIYVTGWMVNLTWSAVNAIRERLRLRHLDKHPEECVTSEQIAQDFEDIAKAIREKDKKDKEGNR